MVIRKVGEDRLLHRAAELALEKAWREVIEKNSIQAIGIPEMQIVKLARGNPLEWKARVGVLPEIKLPDYRFLAQTIRDQSFLETKNVDISKSRNVDMAQSRNSEMSYDNEKVEKVNTNEKNEKIEEIRKQESKEAAKEKQRLALLEKIAAETTMEIPAALKEAEKIKMAQELRAGLEAMGLKWEDYVAHVKKSEQEIADGFESEADKRARYGLVLREIAKREHIEPSSQEVEERVRQIVPSYSIEEQKGLDKERLTAYAYGVLRNEKVFEFLEHAASSM